MAVTEQTYARKTGNIDIVKVTNSNLQDVADWLIANLPAHFVVSVNEMMRSVSFGEEINGELTSTLVWDGRVLGKDQNNKIFVLDEVTLSAFYDPA